MPGLISAGEERGHAGTASRGIRGIAHSAHHAFRSEQKSAIPFQFHAYAGFLRISPKLEVARSNRARVTIHFNYLRGVAPGSSRRVMTPSYETLG